MSDDSPKLSHPSWSATPDPRTEGVPRGSLPADRMQAVLRRIDDGFYTSPGVLEITARRVLADLRPSAPDAPPGR